MYTTRIQSIRLDKTSCESRISQFSEEFTRKQRVCNAIRERILSIELSNILYNGVNGISEYDIRRCKTDKVYESVSKCTKSNTNRDTEKPRVSE